MSLTKVTYSMISGAVVNALDFGADPTGLTDSSNAINTAIASLTYGGTVFLPSGTYKTTSAITLNIDGVSIVGETISSTVVKPVGTFNAIEVHGASYASWANNRSVRQLTLDGSNGCTGNGLSVINCGLRCYFSDLYIHNFSGTANTNVGCGLYVRSSFDHVYERIETRSNSSYGIYVFEIQTVHEGYYEEVSYLTFRNCWAISNNSGGTQWNMAGGDTCYILECKPSEGTTGLQFSRNCNSHKIKNLFYDAPSPGNGTAVRTSTDFCQHLTFEGIHTYQAGAGVTVDDGQKIYVYQVDGAAIPVYVASGATGAVFLGQNVGYTDARTPQKTYPLNYNSAYTPTLNGTGSSLGNGTLTGSYTLTGNVVTFQINLKLGSTTTIGLGTGFSLPLPIASGNCPVTANAYDLSATTWYAFQAYAAGSPAGSVVLGYGNTYCDATVPFTWATGDELIVSGSYLIYE